jgi:hypothetical protein
MGIGVLGNEDIFLLGIQKKVGWSMRRQMLSCLYWISPQLDVVTKHLPLYFSSHRKGDVQTREGFF